MRIAALLGVCATVAIVVLGFTIFGGGSNARASRPGLELAQSSPLTVRGERFRSREQVRVSTGAQGARARANGDGTFVVTIPGATRCDTTRVLARGSAGSYTVLKLLPPPACQPARTG
jgi:hypothetical protein